MVPLSGLGAKLTISSQEDHPRIVEFAELSKSMVPEDALEKLLNDPDENAAEEFAELYDDWRAEMKRQGFEAIRASDASKKFIQKSKEELPLDIPEMEAMTVGDNKTVLMFLIAAD